MIGPRSARTVCESVAEPVVRFVRPRSGRRNLVSLTPLIDVVFILLVFFMLASNFFEWRELKLTTTVAEHEGNSVTEGMHVTLGSDGELKLDGQSMPLQRLCKVLSSRLSGDPDLAVMLQPEEGVSVQAMVAVFDRLVDAGATRLSLVVAPIVSDSVASRERTAGSSHRHRGTAEHRP